MPSGLILGQVRIRELAEPGVYAILGSVPNGQRANFIRRALDDAVRAGLLTSNGFVSAPSGPVVQAAGNGAAHKDALPAAPAASSPVPPQEPVGQDAVAEPVKSGALHLLFRAFKWSRSDG